jgi:hypothetical protein
MADTTTEQHASVPDLPLLLGGGYELVDDDLGSVAKVAELRLPQHQRHG